MSEYKLTTEIIKISDSENWETAKLEWTLNEVYEAESPETCLCGHFPIIEICVIRNKINNQFATVGNCCVKKFIGLPSDKIFQAVKRVRKDSTKPLNSEAVRHAFKKGWINEWEFNFSLDTVRKRKLSEKQALTRSKVNEKMLLNMKRSTPHN